MQESKNVPLSSLRLMKFYKDWLAGEVEGHTTSGLCICLIKYVEGTYPDELLPRLQQEMRSQFISAGLDYNFPFNEGGYEEYTFEHRACICHKNKHRIQWVLDRIQDYEGEKNDK